MLEISYPDPKSRCLKGVPRKYPLVVIGSQIRGSTFWILPGVWVVTQPFPSLESLGFWVLWVEGSGLQLLVFVDVLGLGCSSLRSFASFTRYGLTLSPDDPTYKLRVRAVFITQTPRRI